MSRVAAPANDRGAQSQKRVVLVVEDEILVRAMVADYLRDAGFAVIEAADSNEAMAILASRTPVDVVFTDVNMPGPTDGMGIARWVRENMGAPVLLTSGAANISHAEREALGRRFLPKPYIFADVEKRLRALLGD